MIEVQVTDKMLMNARDKATAMGHLHNSIMSGAGNLTGFVGEEVVRAVLGGVEENTYEYDIVLEDGTRVEVKSKLTSVEPKPHYECSISKFNTKQDCDYYAFVRVHNSYSKAWFLGVYKKDEYMRDAVFMKKGDVDPSNNFKVRADCYNLPISRLQLNVKEQVQQ